MLGDSARGFLCFIIIIIIYFELSPNSKTLVLGLVSIYRGDVDKAMCMYMTSATLAKFSPACVYVSIF